MVENFPNLIKDMILHIYEFQQTPSRINSVSQDTMKLLKDRKQRRKQMDKSTLQISFIKNRRLENNWLFFS